MPDDATETRCGRTRAGLQPSINLHTSVTAFNCVQIFWTNTYYMKHSLIMQITAQKEWVGSKSWFASASEGKGFGEGGFAQLANLENFEKMKPILPSFHAI